MAAHNGSAKDVSVVQIRTRAITGLPERYRGITIEVGHGLQSTEWTRQPSGVVACEFWARVPFPRDGGIQIRVAPIFPWSRPQLKVQPRGKRLCGSLDLRADAADAAEAHQGRVVAGGGGGMWRSVVLPLHPRRLVERLGVTSPQGQGAAGSGDGRVPATQSRRLAERLGITTPRALDTTRLQLDYVVLTLPAPLAHLPELELLTPLCRPLHSYAHGGFMGAALSLLADPQWCALLLQMTGEEDDKMQAHIAQLAGLQRQGGGITTAQREMLSLMLVLENSPVLCAYGLVRSGCIKPPPAEASAPSSPASPGATNPLAATATQPAPAWQAFKLPPSKVPLMLRPRLNTAAQQQHHHQQQTVQPSGLGPEFSRYGHVPLGLEWDLWLSPDDPAALSLAVVDHGSAGDLVQQAIAMALRCDAVARSMGRRHNASQGISPMRWLVDFATALNQAVNGRPDTPLPLWGSPVEPAATAAVAAPALVPYTDGARHPGLERYLCLTLGSLCVRLTPQMRQQLGPSGRLEVRVRVVGNTHTHSPACLKRFEEHWEPEIRAAQGQGKDEGEANTSRRDGSAVAMRERSAPGRVAGQAEPAGGAAEGLAAGQLPAPASRPKIYVALDPTRPGNDADAGKAAQQRGAATGHGNAGDKGPGRFFYPVELGDMRHSMLVVEVLDAYISRRPLARALLPLSRLVGRSRGAVTFTAALHPRKTFGSLVGSQTGLHPAPSDVAPVSPEVTTPPVSGSPGPVAEGVSHHSSSSGTAESTAVTLASTAAALQQRTPAPAPPSQQAMDRRDGSPWASATAADQVDGSSHYRRHPHLVTRAEGHVPAQQGVPVVEGKDPREPQVAQGLSKSASMPHDRVAIAELEMMRRQRTLEARGSDADSEGGWRNGGGGGLSHRWHAAGASSLQRGFGRLSIGRMWYPHGSSVGCDAATEGRGHEADIDEGQESVDPGPSEDDEEPEGEYEDEEAVEEDEEEEDEETEEGPRPEGGPAGWAADGVAAVTAVVPAEGAEGAPRRLLCAPDVFLWEGASGPAAAAAAAECRQQLADAGKGAVTLVLTWDTLTVLQAAQQLHGLPPHVAQTCTAMLGGPGPGPGWGSGSGGLFLDVKSGYSRPAQLRSFASSLAGIGIHVTAICSFVAKQIDFGDLPPCQDHLHRNHRHHDRPHRKHGIPTTTSASKKVPPPRSPEVTGPAPASTQTQIGTKAGTDAAYTAGEGHLAAGPPAELGSALGSLGCPVCPADAVAPASLRDGERVTAGEGAKPGVTAAAAAASGAVAAPPVRLGSRRLHLGPGPRTFDAVLFFHGLNGLELACEAGRVPPGTCVLFNGASLLLEDPGAAVVVPDGEEGEENKEGAEPEDKAVVAEVLRVASWVVQGAKPVAITLDRAEVAAGGSPAHLVEQAGGEKGVKRGEDAGGEGRQATVVSEAAASEEAGVPYCSGGSSGGVQGSGGRTEESRQGADPDQDPGQAAGDSAGGGGGAAGGGGGDATLKSNTGGGGAGGDGAGEGSSGDGGGGDPGELPVLVDREAWRRYCTLVSIFQVYGGIYVQEPDCCPAAVDALVRLTNCHPGYLPLGFAYGHVGHKAVAAAGHVGRGMAAQQLMEELSSRKALGNKVQKWINEGVHVGAADQVYLSWGRRLLTSEELLYTKGQALLLRLLADYDCGGGGLAVEGSQLLHLLRGLGGFKFVFSRFHQHYEATSPFTLLELGFNLNLTKPLLRLLRNRGALVAMPLREKADTAAWLALDPSLRLWVQRCWLRAGAHKHVKEAITCLVESCSEEEFREVCSALGGLPALQRALRGWTRVFGWSYMRRVRVAQHFWAGGHTDTSPIQHSPATVYGFVRYARRLPGGGMAPGQGLEVEDEEAAAGEGGQVSAEKAAWGGGGVGWLAARKGRLPPPLRVWLGPDGVVVTTDPRHTRYKPWLVKAWLFLRKWAWCGATWCCQFWLCNFCCCCYTVCFCPVLCYPYCRSRLLPFVLAVVAVVMYFLILGGVIGGAVGGTEPTAHSAGTNNTLALNATDAATTATNATLGMPFG